MPCTPSLAARTLHPPVESVVTLLPVALAGSGPRLTPTPTPKQGGLRLKSPRSGFVQTAGVLGFPSGFFSKWILFHLKENQ